MKTQNLQILLIVIFLASIYGCMAPTKTETVAQISQTQQQVSKSQTAEGIDKYEPNNTTEKAPMIEIGSEVNGTIYPQGDKDFYKFTIDAETIKTISVEMINPGGRIEPVMTIHDPDGKMTRKTPKQRGANITVQIEVSQSGDYFIEISDPKRGQSTKPYSVKVTTEEKTAEEKSDGIEFTIE